MRRSSAAARRSFRVTERRWLYRLTAALTVRGKAERVLDDLSDSATRSHTGLEFIQGQPSSEPTAVVGEFARQIACKVAAGKAQQFEVATHLGDGFEIAEIVVKLIEA